MGIVLDEWKRVVEFITGPHIPMTLAVISFLTTFPVFFFMLWNLVFLSVFFEIVMWAVGLVLAFSAGFARTNLKGESMLKAFGYGARTLILLHIPRYFTGGLAIVLAYFLGTNPAGPDLIFGNLLMPMAEIGTWLIIFVTFAGGLLGGIGGLIGRALGTPLRLSTTRPTRKKWKN